MEEKFHEDLKEYGNKIDIALNELKEITISSNRQTFWEKWAPILIPTVISTIIGVSAFFAAFNLSEYKIGVMMTERLEIKQSIKNIEQKMIEDDIDEKGYDLFVTYTNTKIENIRVDLKLIKDSLDENLTDHNDIKVILNGKVDDLEHRIDILEINYNGK